MKENNDIENIVGQNTLDDSLQSSPMSQKKKSTKKFFIMLSIIAILFVIYNVKRVSMIIESWNSYSNAASSYYTIEVAKKNIVNGQMIMILDGEYSIEYNCKLGVDLFSFKSKCIVEFQDGSTSFGEFFWNKNINEINALLNKYRDHIVTDNADWIFNINNESELRKFFQEFKRIPDMQKAYSACKSSTSGVCPDYMYLRNVTIKGEKYGGIYLFDWAMRVGL